jgi:hypothetical protein
MWFLSHNIPKRNKLAEKISQKNPEYMCTWWRLLRVPDEGYWAYLMKVIERTWWRLLSVPDEGYWAYLMKVIPETCRAH